MILTELDNTTYLRKQTSSTLYIHLLVVQFDVPH